MKWERRIVLGDVADISLGKMLDQKKNKGTYQPYLANINVRWGEFDLENLPQMRFMENETDRYGLRYGDILVCEGGEPGRCALWKEQIPNMKYQKALHRVRVNDEFADCRWVFYRLLYAGFRGEFEQYFSGTTTIKHMPNEKIKKFAFLLPPLPTQHRIASILSAYDDLIENNRKQIKLLEEAAQRLYKEWFVDFKFPGHENVKIVDGVPEGWERVAIADIADYLNGYAFKPADWHNMGKPIIKIKELNNGITKDTPRNNGKDIPSKYNIMRGDIVFSWSATLTAKIWDAETGLLNQHLFKVTPQKGISREFVFQAILNSLKEFANLTTGATMKHIQRGKLEQVFVLLPSSDVMNIYEKLSRPIREYILILNKEVTVSTEARDRLLPKLMSGEIEV